MLNNNRDAKAEWIRVAGFGLATAIFSVVCTVVIDDYHHQLISLGWAAFWIILSLLPCPILWYALRGLTRPRVQKRRLDAQRSIVAQIERDWILAYASSESSDSQELEPTFKVRNLGDRKVPLTLRALAECDGQLIISGGPKSGKTASLAQIIRYQMPSTETIGLGDLPLIKKTLTPSLRNTMPSLRCSALNLSPSPLCKSRNIWQTIKCPDC